MNQHTARWLKRHGFTNGLWRLDERDKARAAASKRASPRVLLHLSDRDVTGVIVGQGILPGEVRVRWDDTDEVTHIERYRLEVV